MSNVNLHNKLPQVLTIGLKNESDPSKTDAVKIGPRRSLLNVDSDRLTSYTQGLIQQGRLTFTPATA